MDVKALIANSNDELLAGTEKGGVYRSLVHQVLSTNTPHSK